MKNYAAMSEKFDICVDFDGTCVTHDFPSVGKDILAAPVLKQLVSDGHRLILFTMRSNREKGEPCDIDSSIVDAYGNFLDDAVKWFADNEIPLYGIQSNPTQGAWTSSPKAYGQIYIDDAALGCPLKMSLHLSDRPHVDWFEVAQKLFIRGIISEIPPPLKYFH